MEKMVMGGALKVEDYAIGSAAFGDLAPAGGFAGAEDERVGSSLGFMELLGFQDLGPAHSSLVDLLLPSPEAVAYSAPSPASTAPESSEVLNNLPATPNSSTLSSASSEAVNDDPQPQGAKEEDQEGDEEEGQTKAHKKSKASKKANQKRQREPRVAFMTKSEVDHLEDGYRWRKYGQKAVKNSPFPRSYYRCTNGTCNVKKRVERCLSDPSVVVTTYEGQHTHLSPTMARPSLAGISPYPGNSSDGGYSIPAQRTFLLPHGQQPPRYATNPSAPSVPPSNFPSFRSFGTAPSPSTAPEKRFCTPATISNLLVDHGLLQDIVPTNIVKEE